MLSIYLEHRIKISLFTEELLQRDAQSLEIS